MPELETRLRTRYSPDELEIYGIMAWSVADVTDETIIDFADQTGVSFPMMRDDDATYFEYDVTAESAPFPLDVVVDKNGVVRLISERYDPDELEALIDELLAE